MTVRIIKSIEIGKNSCILAGNVIQFVIVSEYYKSDDRVRKPFMNLLVQVILYQWSAMKESIVEHGVALEGKGSIGAMVRFREGMSPAASIPTLRHSSNFPRELQFGKGMLPEPAGGLCRSCRMHTLHAIKCLYDSCADGMDTAGADPELPETVSVCMVSVSFAAGETSWCSAEWQE